MLSYTSFSKSAKSDFGIIANFFVQKRKNKDYKPDDPRTIQHVDEVLKLLSVMTGDRDYESILYDGKRDDEVKNMCEVAQRLKREGREEGIKQGIKQGIQSSVNMLRKLGKTDEEILSLIMEEYKLDEDEVKNYM